MNLVSCDGAGVFPLHGSPSVHVTRRALESLAVHLHSLWFISSEHKPPDPRRCSVDVAAVRAARSTAGTHARTHARATSLAHFTCRRLGFALPKRPGRVHYSPGRRDQVQIKSYSCGFAHVSSSKTETGAERNPQTFLQGQKGTFVGFYFRATRKKCLEYGEDSTIFLHRRRGDTLPIRRWWQNTGG